MMTSMMWWWVWANTLNNDRMIKTIWSKYEKKMYEKKKNLVTHTTTLRWHDITWHDMMTTRWTRCTQSHYGIKKKIKLLVWADRHTASTTSTSVKKVLIQYEPPNTHIHAQRNTHMIPYHRNICCNNMTTSQHRSSLTTLHDKCNTQTVTTSQQHVTKNLWWSQYIRST
jgi:hypothetical protein